jgi:hypothetical protein
MEPDDLYGLPMDRFIPERGALAKALRADKRRDEAAEVAALRKPSVAAWAVNQLVRTQGDGVRELFDAGDGLRDAQADLLAGHGDGRTLRAANERERDAVDTLVEAARGLLSSEGHELSAAVVERVADTLHAAALDAGARKQVRDGRIERELRHAGLGLGESPGPAPPATPAPKAKAKAKPGKPAAPAKPAEPTARKQPDAGPSREEAAEARRATREQAKREKAEREQAERERTEARKAARTAEVAARRRAERAGHALKAAEERRTRAAHALEQADAALTAAQEEAQEAVDAQRAAQAEYEQLS